MKTTILLFLSLFFVGCTTVRPTPLPLKHAQSLPWGAIDLDINSKKPHSIKHSLGSVLTQKADKYSGKRSIWNRSSYRLDT